MFERKNSFETGAAAQKKKKYCFDIRSADITDMKP
jgi:hypothetical protein